MEDYKEHSAADLVMGCFLLLFGAVIGIAALGMPVYKSFLDAPGFFPFLLSIIFIMLGGMMTFTALRRKGLLQLKAAFTKESLLAFIKDARVKKALILIAMMVVYIFILVGRIHFTIATILYLMANFLYLKSTAVWKMALISVITAILISTLFTSALRIPLP